MSESPSTKIEPVYFLYTGELYLNAPADVTWSCVLDYTAWQDFPLREHVSGPVDEAGEVVVLKKEKGVAAVAPYLARTILLDRDRRRIVWKVYPQSAETAAAVGAHDFMGIVDFRVDETPDGSCFINNNYYEYELAYRDEADFERMRETLRADIDKSLDGTRPRLTELVERVARTVTR